jgi:hypothetical protein
MMTPKSAQETADRMRYRIDTRLSAILSQPDDFEKVGVNGKIGGYILRGEDGNDYLVRLTVEPVTDEVVAPARRGYVRGDK